MKVETEVGEGGVTALEVETEVEVEVESIEKDDDPLGDDPLADNPPGDDPLDDDTPDEVSISNSLIQACLHNE